MSNRKVIAIVIYMMVQAVVFGIGVVLVLATPLANIAMTLMPFVVASSLVMSAPIAWWLAPLARAAHERKLNAQEPGRSTDDQPGHGYHASWSDWAGRARALAQSRNRDWTFLVGNGVLRQSLRWGVMAASPTDIVFDVPAPEFDLPGVDGRRYRFADVAGEKGTVVVFICNHCPYVLAVINRLAADARALKGEGIGFAAICSNDAASYPDDSFPKMQAFAKRHDLPFPYLHDETQAVARAYGAVCTPDFFGYGADGKLKYRGRLDEGRTSPPPPGAQRELVEAMRAIAADNQIPADQTPSIGCSIKWKPGR